MLFAFVLLILLIETNGKQNVRMEYVSAGSANGRELFEGVRGGIYYLTDFGNKKYIKPTTENVIVFYSQKRR